MSNIEDINTHQVRRDPATHPLVYREDASWQRERLVDVFYKGDKL